MNKALRLIWKFEWKQMTSKIEIFAYCVQLGGHNSSLGKNASSKPIFSSLPSLCSTHLFKAQAHQSHHSIHFRSGWKFSKKVSIFVKIVINSKIWRNVALIFRMRLFCGIFKQKWEKSDVTAFSHLGFFIFVANGS